MKHPIDRVPEAADRLIQPPLVDMMHFDADLSAYSITFVLCDDVSSAPTEHVLLTRADRLFGETDAVFRRLGELISPGGSLVRVVHGGGDDFTFHFSDGKHLELVEQPDRQLSEQAMKLLKQLAEAAESAFVRNDRHQFDKLAAGRPLDARSRRALRRAVQRDKKRQS